jgi:hypothetical protein
MQDSIISIDCPVNPIICDFGLSKMMKKEGAEGVQATLADGMEETNAVGISHRYAAPEAFNRMYQKKGQDEEGKPVGMFLC